MRFSIRKDSATLSPLRTYIYYKLKAFSKYNAAASREPNAGKPKRCSMSDKIETVSY